MPIKNAIKLAETKTGNKVLGCGESEDVYFFAMDTDDEAYVSVNKTTKEIGSIWIWEFIDLVDKGVAKILHAI